jgi:hypothetical protein
MGAKKFLGQATRKGVTSIGDGWSFARHLELWSALKSGGELDLHVVLFQDGSWDAPELTPVPELVARYQDYDLPGPPGVKTGIDGAVESGTSPMVDGYADASIEAELLLEPEALSAYVAELDKHGFQVKIHAIGSGAVRSAIDALEPVILANGGNKNRHHIDHTSHVNPSDMKRMAELGIPATVWGVLNAPVSYNMDIVRPMLTEAQWARAYPNREMVDSGVHLSAHTDAPQANMWPWFGFEATVTRGYPGKPDVPLMGPDQALTIEETIRINTLNGAWTLRLDDVTGSIETGKWADMIVLNHNLFEVPATQIHKTEVQRTIFKGEVVYENGN